MFEEFVAFTRHLYQTDNFIPLHSPIFCGNEIEYVNDAIESTFVSTASDYVLKLEQNIVRFTGAEYCVATINGTAALHLALHCSDVSSGDEVLTQAFSFVGTANAIKYCGADPVFIDISATTLGMCALSLENYLGKVAEIRKDGTYNKITGRRIAACVPMHTFGHPVEIESIYKLCQEWDIKLVEDAAEALGSYRNSTHCGLTGHCGILSFNGNKVITTGGGGAVITNHKNIYERLNHIATTAKLTHAWNYQHDQIGYNYKLPGLNAALGCAQFESINMFLKDKRNIARNYSKWAENTTDVEFINQKPETQSNFWLNCLKFKSRKIRDEFLQATNDAGIMTRPPWTPLCDLPMYQSAICADELPVTRELVQVLANIPSGMRKPQ